MASAVLAHPAKIKEVDYPTTDGKPLAETEIHFSEIVELWLLLKDYFENDPNVYAGSNNLIYYKEGDNKARFAADVYVVFGVPNITRRIYKVWEEKHPPTVIFEVSSRGT